MALLKEKYNKNKAKENALNLRDKKGVFCLYNNMDWLDVRVSDDNPVLDVFKGLSVNSSSFSFDFGGFTAEYRGYINWENQILIDILDINAKKVGQLAYRTFIWVKTNTNQPTKLGFDGVFSAILIALYSKSSLFIWFCYGHFF